MHRRAQNKLEWGDALSAFLFFTKEQKKSIFQVKSFQHFCWKPYTHAPQQHPLKGKSINNICVLLCMDITAYVYADLINNN